MLISRFAPSLLPVRLFAAAVLALSFFSAARAQPTVKKVAPPVVNVSVPKERPSFMDRMNKLDPNSQSRAEKLRSPREMLKTFYFAMVLYDAFPQMIDDALLCMDLDSSDPTAAEGAHLAVELEQLLRDLELPLIGVPDTASFPGGQVKIHEAAGIRVGLQQHEDGGWRFDRETLRRVPAMRKALAEKPKSAPDKNLVREGFANPRESFRQFIVDALNGDFYGAARALDLSSFSNDQRAEQGPILAQQLAFVVQRRGYVFFAELPTQPVGSMFIWHADRHGRIALERTRQPDGKDAWLFSRKTVTKLDRMYQAAKDDPVDPRFARMGIIIPPLPAKGTSVMKQNQAEGVPPHLASPRAVLKGFFRAMDGAESNDAKLAEALEFIDLRGVPASDRASLGPKLAGKLEAVLRKTRFDLSAISDNWNAPTCVLGEGANRIDVVRQHDGCWRFSDATVARVQAVFDQLAGKEKSDKDRNQRLESARDAVVTFLNAAANDDFDQAATCLDLHWLPAAARDDLGPALAFKLKFALDRLGRLYVQEIPDDPDGSRFVAYRGDLGRIVVARKPDEPGKGTWLFTSDTVKKIDPIFRAVMRQPIEESVQGEHGALRRARFLSAPGVWLRLHLPDWIQVRTGMLELHQWIGLGLTALASFFAAWGGLKMLHRAVSGVLHWSGSTLTLGFVASKLLPLTWLASVWLFFEGCSILDLPLGLMEAILPTRKFVLAVLVGWFGCRLVDFVVAVSTNSELLQRNRSLSDMVVPVTMRVAKAVVWLLIATYMVFQIGEGELVGRFFTGLGVLGLAASLAAQDALKSFFGTLLLIGERTFKIGDRIIVDGKEGVVEQVGFRTTEMRTPEGSLLTIPNSTLASASIDNQGVRSFRRLKTAFLVSSDTPLAKLMDLRERLHAWLINEPLVRNDLLDIHIHQIAEKGIEVAANLTLSTAAKADENRVRQDFHCEVIRAAEDLKIAIAGAIPKPAAPPQIARAA